MTIVCHLRSMRRSELKATISIVTAPAAYGIALRNPTLMIESPACLSRLGSQIVTPQFAGLVLVRSKRQTFPSKSPA